VKTVSGSKQKHAHNLTFHTQLLELKVKCMCCSATEEKEAMELK
jgi:hypothetical protein